MNSDTVVDRVTWSGEDNEHVGLCAEFPSLSWLAPTPEKALSGIRRVVADAVADMVASGESVPEALAEKKFSGRFMVRIPSSVYRALSNQAAEQGLSINRLVSAKLMACLDVVHASPGNLRPGVFDVRDSAFCSAESRA